MEEFKRSDALKAYNLLEKQIQEVYHAIAVRQGMSDSAQIILLSIWDLGEGCTQREICGYACMGKQTVHSSVRRLQQEGIIECRSAGREVRLLLTDKGRRLMEEKIVPISRAENMAFDAMTEAERRELLRLTQLYLERFQALIKEKI